MFLVFILIVAGLTLSLPWTAPLVAKKFHFTLREAPMWLPILAAVLYMASLFLPDNHISSETNTFQEHFVGGGVYTTMLFIYFSKLLGWQPRWYIAFAALFAWTSA